MAADRQNFLCSRALTFLLFMAGLWSPCLNAQTPFQTAQPDDSLVKTLRRIVAGQGAQMVPVLEGDRIVGIITPQNLANSMGLLNQRRKLRQPE